MVAPAGATATGRRAQAPVFAPGGAGAPVASTSTFVTPLEELVQAVPERWRCAAKLQRARARSSALAERHGLRLVEGGRHQRTLDQLIASVEAALLRGAPREVDRGDVLTLLRLIQVDSVGPGEREAVILLHWLAVQAGVFPD